MLIHCRIQCITYVIICSFCQSLASNVKQFGRESYGKSNSSNLSRTTLIEVTCGIQAGLNGSDDITACFHTMHLSSAEKPSWFVCLFVWLGAYSRHGEKQSSTSPYKCPEQKNSSMDVSPWQKIPGQQSAFIDYLQYLKIHTQYSVLIVSVFNICVFNASLHNSPLPLLRPQRSIQSVPTMVLSDTRSHSKRVLGTFCILPP
jgi:hypothetical protein